MQFCCIVLSSFHGFIAVLWHQNCYNTCKISSCRVCSLFITPANRGSPQTETSWIHAMYVHTVAVPIHCRGVSGLWIDKVRDKTCNNYLISRSFTPYHFIQTNLNSKLLLLILEWICSGTEIFLRNHKDRYSRFRTVLFNKQTQSYVAR